MTQSKFVSKAWHGPLKYRLRSLLTPSIAPLDRLPFQVFFALILIAIATAIAFILEPALHLSGIVSIYFLVVVVSAYWGGVYAAGFSVILAVSLLNFFFIEPRHTLFVETVQSWATLAGLLIVSTLMTSLTFHIQRAREMADQERLRSNAARDMLEKLVSLDTAHDIQIAGCEEVFNQLGLPTQVVELRGEGFTCIMASGVPFNIDESAIRFALARELAIGPCSGELQDKFFWCVPLIRPSGFPCAIVVCCESHISRTSHEPHSFLDTSFHFLLLLAQQINLALNHEQSLRREMQAIRDKEEESLRNTLLASVAHDLRNPLSSILGAATSLMSTEVDLSKSKRDRLLSSIRDEALQISKVTDNVLTMVRLQVGTNALKADWQSIEEIVGGVVSRHRRRDGIARLDIRTRIESDLPLVWGDAALLSQMLDNLLDNAQKYVSDDALVMISAAVDDEFVELVVEDFGNGFPSPVVGRLSEKFARGSETNEKPGLGLGLAICESIIQAHRGELILENRLSGGSGAVVRVRVPTERKGRRAPRATAYHR